MHWDAKVPYCGRKECWDRLVETIDLTKVHNVTTFPFGEGSRRGRSLALLAGGSVRNWQGRFWNPFTREFQDRPVYTDGRLTPEEAARFHAACQIGRD
jgi:hypothetical protein